MSAGDTPGPHPGEPPAPEVASNSELDWSQRFAHGMFDWALENRVTARELAMLRAMNSITDRPNWETEVFDDEVAASWGVEAAAKYRLMSPKAWAWCLVELRDKAREFALTGRVVAYDVGPSISKSRLDGSGSHGIGNELKALVQDFIDRMAIGDGDHLDKENQVLNIVDPSLYPLAYGHTRVLPEGEAVNIARPWAKLGRGTLSALTPHLIDVIFRRAGKDPDRAPETFGEGRDDHVWRPHTERKWDELKPWRYSNRLQWLPCDVKFVGSDDDCKVKVDSYISNLHPGSHHKLYSVIERVISASIQPWNDTLTYACPRIQRLHGLLNPLNIGLGRASPRIRLFHLYSMLPISPNGICWLKEGNFYKELQDISDAWDTLDPGERDGLVRRVIARMERAEHSSSVDGDTILIGNYPQEILDRLEPLLHPEPGVLLTFQDWKAGTIPPKTPHWEGEDHSYVSSEDEEEREARRLIDEELQDESCSEPDDEASDADAAWDSDDFNLLFEIGAEDPRTGSHTSQAQHGLESDRDCPHCPCDLLKDLWLKPTRKTAKDVEYNHLVKQYDHEYRHVQLHRDFSSQGLQVFVRIQSIELTPNKPRYSGGDWALEGLLNEHIVATSVYFFEMENVADTVSMSFRVPADFSPEDVARPGFGNRKRLISFLAIDDLTEESGIPRTQELGSVAASEGKLVAYPNTLQTRMSPVDLHDPSKPGHVRVLALCLVDPNYRLVSTKRVPPQRFDWWLRDVFPWAFLTRRGLPAEVLYMIAEEARGAVLLPREAERLRSRIAWERERMMTELNNRVYHLGFYENLMAV